MQAIIPKTPLQHEMYRLIKMGLTNDHLIARIVGCTPSNVNNFRTGRLSKDRKTKYYDTSNKMTECICPNCRKKHKKMMNWAGNGTPRFFCLACKGIADRDYSDGYGYGDTREVESA